jgi:hypothetical protein
MTINTYQFSYEISVLNNRSWVNIIDDYIQKTIKDIKNVGGIPDFTLPAFYRCNAKYTSLDIPEDYIFPENYQGNLQAAANIYFYRRKPDGSVSKSQSSISKKVFRSRFIELYQYVNDDTLVLPKSNFTEMYDDLLENFYNVFNEETDTPDENKEIINPRIIHTDEVLFDSGLTHRRYKVDVVLTYSDDDPSAGDEYIEPPKPKKIYLANLDFGYRRFRRNKSKRRKYRKFY